MQNGTQRVRAVLYSASGGTMASFVCNGRSEQRVLLYVPKSAQKWDHEPDGYLAFSGHIRRAIKGHIAAEACHTMLVAAQGRPLCEMAAQKIACYFS